MTTLYNSLALIFAIVFVSTGKAEIYRWLDDEGKVNYGDCPPITCESDELLNAPAPSDQAVKEAQERFKRLQEYQEKIRESYKEEAEQSDHSTVNYQTHATINQHCKEEANRSNRQFSDVECQAEAQLPDSIRPVVKPSLMALSSYSRTTCISGHNYYRHPGAHNISMAHPSVYLGA